MDRNWFTASKQVASSNVDTKPIILTSGLENKTEEKKNKKQDRIKKAITFFTESFDDFDLNKSNDNILKIEQELLLNAREIIVFRSKLAAIMSKRGIFLENLAGNQK